MLLAPMPLDLHVLGLSLAFILSQDQTLRCLYLFLFFFCVLTETLPSRPPGRSVCYRRIDRVAIMFNMTLLLYYFLSIVIISMSSLSRAFREKRCKVTTFFSFPQTFCSKFCCRPSGASRPPPDDRFLKSECKVTPFVRNRQIFSPLFSTKIPNKSAIAWESTPAEHEKKR